MGRYQDLLVYQKAYELAMKIFIRTKYFPAEEKYSLVDQIRRSSRSVCANLAEACRRSSYKKYFISKISDADSENTETQVWLDFSRDCGYINASEYEAFTGSCIEVGKLVGAMLQNPEKFT